MNTKSPERQTAVSHNSMRVIARKDGGLGIACLVDTREWVFYRVENYGVRITYHESCDKIGTKLLFSEFDRHAFVVFSPQDLVDNQATADAVNPEFPTADS